MKVLDWAGGVFRWAGGAVAPMFVRPVAPVPLAWATHVLLVLVLVVAAFVVQKVFRLNTELIHGLEAFKSFWLAAVVLIAYLLLWAAGVLRDALAPAQPEPEFPDLDDAWAGVLAALANQGIPLRDTPLYLVLGDLPGGVEPLFRAVPHGLGVCGGTPSGASLQVFANRNAIYLTVPGATLLGAQAAMGIIDLMAGPSESARLGQSIGFGGSIMLAGYESQSARGLLTESVNQSFGVSSIGGSIGGSVAASDQLQEIARIHREARERNRGVTAEERNRLQELEDLMQAKSPRRRKRPAPATAPAGSAPGSVLQNPPLVAEADARAAHLGDLIAAARWPTAPISGVILAVPATALEQDEAAQQWGLVARHDLATLERHLRLRAPVFAVVGGVEELPGGRTFFDKFSPNQTHRRLGKGFPLNPDARPDQAAAAIEKTAEYVLGELLPLSAVKLTGVTGNLAADTAVNADLVRFYDAARRRGPHLGRLLSRAVGQADRAAVFGGCYLAVVLSSNANEAVFVKEFFDRVLSTAQCVAWTPEAYARDSKAHGLAVAGNAALAALALAVLGLAGYVGYLNFGK